MRLNQIRKAAAATDGKIYWHQVTGAINPKTDEPGYRELPGRAYKPPQNEAHEQVIMDRIMAAAEKRLQRRKKNGR